MSKVLNLSLHVKYLGTVENSEKSNEEIFHEKILTLSLSALPGS